MRTVVLPRAPPAVIRGSASGVSSSVMVCWMGTVILPEAASAVTWASRSGLFCMTKLITVIRPEASSSGVAVKVADTAVPPSRTSPAYSLKRAWSRVRSRSASIPAGWVLRICSAMPLAV
jgi:hypothetical protein